MSEDCLEKYVEVKTIAILACLRGMGDKKEWDINDVTAKRNREKIR